LNIFISRWLLPVRSSWFNNIYAPRIFCQKKLLYFTAEQVDEYSFLAVAGDSVNLPLDENSMLDAMTRWLPIMPISLHNPTLPWPTGSTPLMLAPMQGVTNRAIREIFSAWVKPDVLFTEFIRVSGSSRARIAASDRSEISSQEGLTPLVVQLIGSNPEALVAAAQQARSAGAVHINLNLGCPYGRMTTALTGGKLLQRLDIIETLVPALRAVVDGSFSIKLRAGYADHQAVFRLLPLFESTRVDFLILHPRTVQQNYTGRADHSVTREVVRQTSLPVIANGDIRTAAEGKRILQQTGAAGLMLGRGAIADPWLFARLRREADESPGAQERLQLMRRFLLEVANSYSTLFCGEKQVLSKLKGVLTAMEEPLYQAVIERLKKAKTLDDFRSRLP
jgi:tRNA-dihydrouridine synthase B